MGEFSDFFESFPEYGPANWDSSGKCLTPSQRAERQLEQERQIAAKLEDARIRKAIAAGQPKSSPDR